MGKKRKRKTYETIEKDNSKAIHFVVQPDYSHIPNKLHLLNQINNRMQIIESKKYKKPRHKKKVFDEE